MRKIVPDPPPSTDSLPVLEDTLVQAMEYALCGLAVGQQSISFLPKSAASIMLLAVLHELDAARSLMESALARVQRRQVRTLH